MKLFYSQILIYWGFLRFAGTAWATLESSAALEGVYFKPCFCETGSVCFQAPLIFIIPTPFGLLLSLPTSHKDHRSHPREELKETLHRLLASQHLGYTAKQL